MMIDTLIVAAVVFAVAKAAFGVLQWVVEENGNKVVRRHLDALYDCLDGMTFRQIAARLMLRTVNAFDGRMPRSGRSRVLLIVGFIIFNLFAYIVGQFYFCSAKADCGTNLGHDFVLEKYGLTGLIIWLCLTIIGTLVLQVLGLWFVFRAMASAAIRIGVTRTVLLLLAAVTVVTLVFFAQYAVQQLATQVAFKIPPRWEKVLPNILAIDRYFVATLILTAAAALPLLALLLVLVLAFFMRILPKMARTAMAWLVWKITTDSTPVLERLGYVTGGIASVSSALVGYLKA